MKTTITILAVALSFMTFNGCSSDRKNIKGRLEITVDYQRQDGRGSNQYAVWIEDTDGNLVKTLYVTRFTAEGGYKMRPDCTPIWVAKADAPSLSKSETDAFTGATPQTGKHTYTWDGTDNNGEPLVQGVYIFSVEATYWGSNTVMYRSEFQAGKREIEITPDAVYNSDEQQNKEMIQGVTARYIP